MGDPMRGLYGKFIVRRTDGSDAPGGKHDGCTYFVLDLEHDLHMPAALKAYARSCKRSHPQLARDLIVVAEGKSRRNLRLICWRGNTGTGDDVGRPGAGATVRSHEQDEDDEDLKARVDSL